MGEDRLLKAELQTKVLKPSKFSSVKDLHLPERNAKTSIPGKRSNAASTILPSENKLLMATQKSNDNPGGILNLMAKNMIDKSKTILTTPSN
jgi:hypothetical protein